MIWVSNCHVTHENGGSKLNILLWVLEESLNSWKDSAIAREVDKFTVLTDSERTDNKLIRLLRFYHSP